MTSNQGNSPMDTIKMSEEINDKHRRFLGTAAMTIATAQFGTIGAATAPTSMTKPADQPTMKPGTNTSFGSLKPIDAGVLQIAYAETVPTESRQVLLLHSLPS